MPREGGRWKVTKGTVTKVGEGRKDVTIKSADGPEKTVHLGKEATVETAHASWIQTQYTEKTGDKVVVYATVEPTKEVVHLFKKL